MTSPKDFVNRKKEELAKKAPKGVDPKKHERCVQDVKRQGHDVGSAHAICTSSMKKTEHKDKLPGGLGDKKKPKDFDQKQLAMGIKVEMEHTNDKTIAQEIAIDHLSEDPKYYTKLKTIEKADGAEGGSESSEVETQDPQSKQIAGMIMTHNRKKLHAFVRNKKKEKVNKSIDFQDTKSSIDSKDQLLAEQTASPQLIKYLQDMASQDISKIPFAKGILTLSKKEPGLYNGFFQDRDGQIIEKFDTQTLAIIAKTMELRELYSPSTPVPVSLNTSPTVEQVIDAAHQRIDMVHNRIDQLEKQPVKDMKSLKVKFGDFELELRKSVKAFVDNYRGAPKVDPNLVKKALSSWKRRNEERVDISNLEQAAREILRNWDQYKEEFNQIVYALEQEE